MTAADTLSMNVSLLQAFCACIAFACTAGAILTACVFVAVLFREHLRTWRPAPRGRVYALVAARKSI